VFLDISASVEERATMVEVVERAAESVTIPFTVGGGIRTVEDMGKILRAGADKVSISTAAVKNPAVILEGARQYGSQCIVAAIDARRVGSEQWEVYVNGGKQATGLDAVRWAQRLESLGAGEILLTSMDRDGTKDGYDLELTRTVSESIGIPVIASGGAGHLEHLYQALTEGKADAVLCASIFHFREYDIKQAREYLRERGVEIGL
jgi:cyclase